MRAAARTLYDRQKLLTGGAFGPKTFAPETRPGTREGGARPFTTIYRRYGSNVIIIFAFRRFRSPTSRKRAEDEKTEWLFAPRRTPSARLNIHTSFRTLIYLGIICSQNPAVGVLRADDSPGASERWYAWAFIAIHNIHGFILVIVRV